MGRESRESRAVCNQNALRSGAATSRPNSGPVFLNRFHMSINHTLTRPFQAGVKNDVGMRLQEIIDFAMMPGPR